MKVSNLDTIHLINKFYYSRLVLFFNKLSATKGKLKNSCLPYESLIRNGYIYTVRIAFPSHVCITIYCIGYKRVRSSRYSTTLLHVVMNDGASLQNSELAPFIPQPDSTGCSQSARFSVSVGFIPCILCSPNARLLQSLYKRSCGCFCPLYMKRSLTHPLSMKVQAPLHNHGRPQRG